LRSTISITIDKLLVCSKKGKIKGTKRAMNRPMLEMKNQPTNPTNRCLFWSLLITGLACLTVSTRASTFWNGTTVNFTQTVTGGVGNSDVLVAGKVALDRGGNQVLYNSVTETGVGASSPQDTMWAVGSPSLIGNLSSANLPNPTNFIPLTTVRAVHAAGNFNNYLLKGNGSGGPITFVVHLTNEDIYLTLTFTSWGQFGSGGFGYNRSTPSAAPPTPTVSITNPAPNAVFAAPANVTISASASVSSGSVSNVSFFNGSSLLGSSQASPFHFTASSLAAGPYSLKAVATAAGVSATSSVVNISVVTPVVTSLSNEVEVNNQFVFSYDVNPGLSYVVERSPDFLNWTPVATNVPVSDPAFFTNPISGGQNFFRVGRMPNP
jgi:Bacterial Ig domain